MASASEDALQEPRTHSVGRRQPCEERTRILKIPVEQQRLFEVPPRKAGLLRIEGMATQLQMDLGTARVAEGVHQLALQVDEMRFHGAPLTICSMHNGTEPVRR